MLEKIDSAYIHFVPCGRSSSQHSNKQLGGGLCI